MTKIYIYTHVHKEGRGKTKITDGQIKPVSVPSLTQHWDLTFSEHSYVLGTLYTPSLQLQASLVAQTVKNLPAMQETQVQSLGQEDPLEKGMQPTLVFSPGEFHGQRSPAVHGVTKSCTRLSN